VNVSLIVLLILGKEEATGNNKLLLSSL